MSKRRKVVIGLWATRMLYGCGMRAIVLEVPFMYDIRDLQIRLRLRVRVRVFQCVPGAHARLREAVKSTRSVVKISSPS